MPWMHLRAFSHDSDIWFSSQYDWQISAFGAKAGRDDRWDELKTSSDHQFETAQLSVSRFHSFIQLGLWLWCFTGVRLGHKVVLCLPWGIPESQKKKRREWASRVPLLHHSAWILVRIICICVVSDKCLSPLFFLFVYWNLQWGRFRCPPRRSLPVPDHPLRQYDCTGVLL